MCGSNFDVVVVCMSNDDKKALREIIDDQDSGNKVLLIVSAGKNAVCASFVGKKRAVIHVNCACH